MKRDTSRVYDVITTRLTMTYIQRVGHNIFEVWRLMSRPRRVCRHSVIMRVVSTVVRLSSRPVVDGLLIAVGHIVVALLKLPASEGR